MRVGLVMPPSPFLLNEKVNTQWGLGCLSSFLKAHGHRVVFVHPTADDTSELEQLLDCDWVGVSVTTPLYAGARSLRAWILEHADRPPVFALGGPHATGAPKACLQDGWDVVVVGEGELAFERAIDDDSRGIVQAPHRIHDLGSLPFPDFEGMRVWEYHWDANGVQGTDLHTTRGCVHNCAFCNNKCSWGQRLHGYPAWYVKRLIDQLHEEYGFRACMVQDDAFPTRRRVFREVTDYFVKRGWQYRCQARADQVTDEMARRLADTGCIGIGIGIESMVQSELDTMNKGTTVADNARCLELCARYDLPVTAYLMLGVPGQTYESAMYTYEIMRLYRPERMHPGMLCPYPGTDFYLYKLKYGLHFRDGDEAKWLGNPYKANPFETQAPVYTDTMTIDEIEAVKDTYWAEWSTGFYAHDRLAAAPAATPHGVN